MGKTMITNFFIYRWRYWIGYGLIGVALISLLLLAGLYIPNGLSQGELAGTVQSASISYDSLETVAVANAPYHMLQQASFDVLGITQFSIKLPSLIIGFFTAIGMIFLLRQWFSLNVAVLASILTVTTGQFLYIAQSGTPGILYMFWSVALLLLATLIAKRSKPVLLWKILFFVAAALSLYTPLSIYILLALLSAVFIHPHLRYLIRQLPKKQILLGVVAAGIVLAPLVVQLVATPALGLQLLGIPSEWPSITANLQTLALQYFGFMSVSNTSLMTPVFGLGSMAIILYGLWRHIKTRTTARSYIIIAWLIFLVPILSINPSYTSIMFVPLLILLATGLSGILSAWYGIFPVNPYARIAGLIPLIVLVGGLTITGLERYAYGYHYSPHAFSNFSRDLQLLPNDTTRLLVSEKEEGFYRAVASHRDNLIISTQQPTDTSNFTATRAAKNQVSDAAITSIVSSSAASEADRFYLYKK